MDPILASTLGLAIFFGAVSPALRRTYFHHFFLGNEAMSAGNWDQALEHFDLFLQQIKARPPLRIARTLCGFSRDPKAMTFINMGVCELQKARPEVATVYFQQAAATEPEFALAHFNLGVGHLACNEPMEAARAFREAERRGYAARKVRRAFTLISPSSAGQRRAGPQTALGLLYSQCGMLDEAVRCFSLAKSNSEPGAIAALGCCLLQKGLADEAAGLVELAQKREPRQPATQLFLLAYWSMRGDFERALHHCALAGELVEQPGWAGANTAETLMVAGRWPEAELTAREALEVDPDSPTAHGVLAQLAVRSREWALALQHADLGLKGVRTGHLLEARAFALKGLGRNPEACEAFRAFLDHITYLTPLECDLEYRGTLARQMLDELKRSEGDR